MITFKNFKLALIFISVLLIMSCSKSEIEDTLTDNRLVNTQWTHRVIGNMSGDVYNYEIIEFTSNKDFTVSIEDMNKIKTQYLANGTYIVEGDKIFCTSPFENTNKKYLMFVDYQNNTIYNASTPNKIYVKQ